MRYGLPKELVSETNEQWIEECISGVMMRGNEDVTEEAALSMCRRHLVSKKGDKGRANIGVINELLEKFSENRRK